MSNFFNDEISKWFPLWRHDGLDALTTIIGYANLLLDSQDKNLTGQQKQFLTTIRNAALKGYSAWNNPGEYIKLMFDAENVSWKWESVQLSEICEIVLSSSSKYINTSNVRVNVAAELPPVRADRAWLSIAIANLLEPSVGYVYNAEFETSISALQTDGEFVSLRVRTGLQLVMDENDNSVESISFPGNNLSVASIILNQHGSRLEFQRLKYDPDEFRSQGIEFRFALPVWQ